MWRAGSYPKNIGGEAFLDDLSSTKEETGKKLERDKEITEDKINWKEVVRKELEFCNQSLLSFNKGISTHEDYLRCAWKRW